MIDEDLIFKCAMTRDYGKVQELSLSSEAITFIDAGNPYLKQFTSLKRLDLSFNKLIRIDGLDQLKELRELNLGYNQICTLDSLSKLVNLRTLCLDHNKIR